MTCRVESFAGVGVAGGDMGDVVVVEEALERWGTRKRWLAAAIPQPYHTPGIAIEAMSMAG